MRKERPTETVCHVLDSEDFSHGGEVTGRLRPRIGSRRTLRVGLNRDASACRVSVVPTMPAIRDVGFQTTLVVRAPDDLTGGVPRPALTPVVIRMGTPGPVHMTTAKTSVSTALWIILPLVSDYALKLLDRFFSLGRDHAPRQPGAPRTRERESRDRCDQRGELHEHSPSECASPRGHSPSPSARGRGGRPALTA